MTRGSRDPRPKSASLKRLRFRGHFYRTRPFVLSSCRNDGSFGINLVFHPTICSEMKRHPTHALEALYKHSARVSERNRKPLEKRKKWSGCPPKERGNTVSRIGDRAYNVAPSLQREGFKTPQRKQGQEGQLHSGSSLHVRCRRRTQGVYPETLGHRWGRTAVDAAGHHERRCRVTEWSFGTRG